MIWPAIWASLGVAFMALFHKAILDSAAYLFTREWWTREDRKKAKEVVSLRSAILSRQIFAHGPHVTCALMDWRVEGKVATLAAFKNGNVELYLTDGGGLSDGDQHATVRDAGSLFLDVMARSRELTFPTRNFRSPRKGCATFWLVSAESTRTSGPLPVEILENRTSPWAGAWQCALATLAEIGELSESQ